MLPLRNVGARINHVDNLANPDNEHFFYVQAVEMRRQSLASHLSASLKLLTKKGFFIFNKFLFFH